MNFIKFHKTQGLESPSTVATDMPAGPLPTPINDAKRTAFLVIDKPAWLYSTDTYVSALLQLAALPSWLCLYWGGWLGQVQTGLSDTSAAFYSSTAEENKTQELYFLRAKNKTHAFY